MKMRILLVVLGMVLVACGENAATDTTAAAADDTTTTTAAATTTAGAADTTAAGSDTTAGDAADMSGVHVGETDVGPVLVGPDGLTLYVFTADTEGTSTCYDACADLWPPVPADTDVSADLDAAMFGTTTRDDGSEQLTVNNMPLYWYEPDNAPGDATGQGFNGVWFVVDESGEIVEGSSAAATDDSVIDYGYGG